MAAGELFLQALFQRDQRLRRFLLPNVRPTGRELGTGGYGSVEEVELDGLVCAGKKIHDAILQERNIGKFVDECQLMSDLRHPHLVQFLGICFLPPSRLPVLVMEKLHSSLDDLLTRHTRHPPLLTAADIPLGLKRSFFVDTARGLHFLHRHSPSPIVHRDLSAGNVLLTPSMVAKISDFGNARMMGLQPDQLARLTRVPGTPVYMPPEAHLNPPCYGPELDIFSLGHLMLYTLIQVFPWDLLPATYRDQHAPGRPLLARTEMQRRERYITQLHQQLGEGHPLVQLVEQCLANEAEERPSAEEVLQRLEQMEIDDPYQNLTRLEMMRMVGQREEEIRQTVEESQRKDREIQRRDEELGQIEAEVGRKEQTIQQKEEEIQQMGEWIQQRDVELGRKEDQIRRKEREKQTLQSQVHRLETQVRELQADRRRDTGHVESLRIQVHQLESEKERTQAQHTSEIEALTQQVSVLSEDNSALSSLVEAKTSSLAVKEQQIEVLRRELVVKERQVEDKGKEVEAKQQQVDSVTQQAQARVELVHSLQDQLSAKEQELLAKEKSFQDQLSAKEQELMSQQKSFQDQLSAKEQELMSQQKSFQDQLSAKDLELMSQQKSFQDQMSALQRRVAALQQQTEGVTRERDALQLEAGSLREGLQTKDAEIAVQRERVRTTEEEVRAKAAEITAKDALLQSKERMVQSLRSEVESLRQRGSEQVPILHPGGASLEWKQCADLPVGMYDTQAVQLKTKVYVQGDTVSIQTSCTIYTYEVPADAWVAMQSPAYLSALTIYHSQLVLVGGNKTTTGRATDQLWVLQDEQTWTQPLPPMPTARCSASAISSGDHLVVAGGFTGVRTDSVEVYDGVQWVRADPLPVACRDIKSTYHNGMWYLMGGRGQLTPVFYTSLQSLKEKATQQPPQSPDSSKQQSVWKTLPDVPYMYSSTTILGGALLTVAGMDSKGKETSSISMYCPLTHSWLHIGDTREAVKSTCSITLTTGEMMVIGGRTGSDRSRHVHEVCLKLQ